jgi:hypothetical protein
MNNYKMLDKQSVQDFTFYFETLLIDLPWADEVYAVAATYRSKLSQPLLKEIYRLHHGIIPTGYEELKAVAQNAENYLRTENKLFLATDRYQSTTKPNSRPGAPRDIPTEELTKTNNTGKRKQTRYPEIPAEQRKRRREEKSCFICGGKDYWVNECTQSKGNPTRP